MSETKSKYNIGRALCVPWLCDNCKYQLGTIVKDEAWFRGEVIFRPAYEQRSVEVMCPSCGSLTGGPFKHE